MSVGFGEGLALMFGQNSDAFSAMHSVYTSHHISSLGTLAETKMETDRTMLDRWKGRTLT